MGYIVLFLIGIVIILAVRLFALRREINRVTKALKESDTGKLTVNILNEPLENLCMQINYGLELRDKARINTQNHEAELRAQISNISHDLRTPLTAILGYISMMRAAPDKMTDYLAIIEERSNALQSLIEQFYELSVIEDSNVELTLEPVDVTAALTNCLLGNYSLFEKKGIQPESNLPEQAVMIISNSQALERIFQNLIQNALKFAKHDIYVSLSDEGTYCALRIANDAENLNDTDIEHLFERFYTADKSRSSGNTGLGLYIVTRLLEKTRGRINDVQLLNARFSLEIHFTKW